MSTSNDSEVRESLRDEKGFRVFRAASAVPLEATNLMRFDDVTPMVGSAFEQLTETLGTGDGFFLPAKTPCSYTPGPQGVEVLEIRKAGEFNIRFVSKRQEFWDKTVATVKANREKWEMEQPPHILPRAPR